MLSAGGSMTTKQKQAAEQWRELVREFETSDLNLKDFCQEKEISRYALQYWRKKPVPTQKSSHRSGLVEIKLANPPVRTAASIQSTGIRIVFPSGIAIEPGTNWNSDSLHRLLALVKAL